METDEIKDIQSLINMFFPFAEELLLKYGEFLPYAGATTSTGDFVAVGSPEKNSKYNSEQLILNLKRDLKKGKQEYLVTAVFYDVRVKDENTGESRDAISIFVEHRNSATAFEFFYPYNITDANTFDVDDSYGNGVPKEIFID